MLPSHRTALHAGKEPSGKLRKGWKIVNRRREKLSPEERAEAESNERFFWNLLQAFLSVLDSIGPLGSPVSASVRYCERFLELLVDVLALLTSRRYLNTG